MKKLLAVLLCLSSFMITVPAQAQTDDSRAIVEAIQRFHAYVESAVNTAFDTFNKLTFEANPNQPATVVGNSQISNARSFTATNTNNLTTRATQDALANRDQKETQRIAGIPASDTILPQQQGYTFRTRPVDLTTGNQAINFDNLIQPLSYGTFDIQNLLRTPQYNFIELASGLYQPVTTISLTNANPKLSDDQIQEVQNTPDYQNLQATVRAYVAAQSVGAGNLYRLMVERIPQPGLGQQVGMTDKNGNPVRDASDLQVQQYLATRRSQNQVWYDQMATASPATVQRETLFVLAEIREQLFQMQLQNERLLATISVMQMQQNNQTTRLNLIQSEQKVDAIIRQKQGLGQTPATPTTGIPGIPGLGG